MNENEKKVVGRMIRIYCHGRHGTEKGLCAECGELERYALSRLERCPFGELKPTCSSCAVHCYKSDMRKKIKAVMRYAGPRMFFRHPLDTLRHFRQEYRRNRRFASKRKGPEK